jgi:hypothetical protein
MKKERERERETYCLDMNIDRQKDTFKSPGRYENREKDSKSERVRDL